eukprot:scaffold661011_cov89-Prasinocladus_malaysianus.AAC.1
MLLPTSVSIWIPTSTIHMKRLMEKASQFDKLGSSKRIVTKVPDRQSCHVSFNRRGSEARSASLAAASWLLAVRFSQDGPYQMSRNERR